MTDTSKRSRLLALAERCERAMEPSRELDWEITRTMGLQSIPVYHQREIHNGEEFALRSWSLGKGKSLYTLEDEAPPFSESVDAALSLVPEGTSWSTEHRADYRDETTALVGEQMTRISGNRPVLALCAASLKALASQEPDDDRK